MHPLRARQGEKPGCLPPARLSAPARGSKIRRMRAFATLAAPLSYGRIAPTGGPAAPLVGRQVANTTFLRALARHSGFEELHLFVGEGSDARAAEELFRADLGERLRIRNLLELPAAVERGELSVLHNSSHLDRFLDLVWLRDRAAPSGLPVTGQIHSLSYPRSLGDYLRALLVPPGPSDAILCSSEAGRRVVLEIFASLRDSLAGAGAALPELACELPVLPLGVDVDALSGGDRARGRERLGVAPDAFAALVLARFSEYDKMDLFPLLTAFARARPRLPADACLVLAGARQGTKTPEMLELWARALGVRDRVRFAVDFPDEQKADLLAAADAFVSPTDNPQETFGISVVEAMAAGLPVVASELDGYRESLADGAGLLVPTRWEPPPPELSDLGPLLHERPLHLLVGQGVCVDVAELARALERLASDPALRRRLGAAAAVRARAVYDWSAVVPRYEDLWRRLAAAPRRAQRAGRHPLALDYARVFAHYPTGPLDPARVLALTEHGQRCAAAGATPPVLPDVRLVFGEDLALRALALCAERPRASELAARLAAEAPERPAWHAARLVAWLEKHGLVAAS